MTTSSLQTLTVQDVQWIHLQVTKQIQSFNFAKLEEATYYQYAYGPSSDLVPQAARFLVGFQKLAPFPGGNSATAFVALLTFLKLNEQAVRLSAIEAEAWFHAASASRAVAEQKIAEVIEPDAHAHHGHNPPVRSIAQGVLDEYAAVISRLA